MGVPSESSENEIEVEAYEWLRAHLGGFLRFDGERVAIKIAPMPDGSFVAPVMVAMLMAADTVLELPDDGDDELHLMVSLERFEERDDQLGRTDRWRAYHGAPQDVNWASIVIDASKFRGFFVDGEVFTRPNPIAHIASALCLEINASHRDDVRRAIYGQYKADAISPTVVSVDPWGFDVRRDHDVMRLRVAKGEANQIGNKESAIAALIAIATQ